MSHRELPVATESDAYNIEVVADDYHTVVSIVSKNLWGEWQAIGEGVARRRPGDPRRDDLGVLLAWRRALEAAIVHTDRNIAQRGYQTFMTPGERARARHLRRSAKPGNAKPDETL